MSLAAPILLSHPVVAGTAKLALVLFPLAHGGIPHDGIPDGRPLGPMPGLDVHAVADALRAWGLDDPLVLIGLAATAVFYAVGVRRIRRGAGGGIGLPNWQVACYWAGWATLAVALASPIHPLGGVLFWVHMTQHELLMLVAAPLLVLGRPMAPSLAALPKPWARGLARAANARAWRRVWAVAVNPLVAWLFHGVVLWAWHVPALFQATLTSDVAHALQHLSFLGSALLFWWAVVHGPRRELGYGMAMLYLLSTGMHSGLLGALLTFARTVWYPAYANGGTLRYGLTALEDQQLGGLIMWAPAGLVYVAAGLVLFAAWLRESERRAARREGRVAEVPARVLRVGGVAPAVGPAAASPPTAV